MPSSLSCRLLFVVGILIFTCQTTASAQFLVPSRGQPVSLFDGYTLNGWSKSNGQPASGWVVKDGAIFRAERGGDLFQINQFCDFELHFEWKIAKGGNSGLKYRVRKYGNQWLGCEYQILDDQSANEANKSGALYALYNPGSLKPKVEPDKWVKSRVVVFGTRIEHWLDDVLIIATKTGTQDWNNRVQKSKFRQHDGFGENRIGKIFLQDHGNPVWFRKIVVIPLYQCRPQFQGRHHFVGSVNSLTNLACGSIVSSRQYRD